MSGSGGGKRPFDGLWLLVEHREQDQRRRIDRRAALLPIADASDGKAVASGEGDLGKAQMLANFLQLFGRNMNVVAGIVRGAIREGEGVLETGCNLVVGVPGHGQILLGRFAYDAASSFVRVPSPFASALVRSDRSFLAKTVIRNTGKLSPLKKVT